MPRHKFDWVVIRNFYDAGHSAQDCQRRFGISNGAWHSAVERGDISPRGPKRTKPRGQTREAVRRLIEQGMSQADAARQLGLSRATVCFHMRQLGIPPRVVATADEDWGVIRQYYNDGHSAAECQRQFGVTPRAWSEAIAQQKIEPRARLEPLEDVLSAGRRRSRRHVKARLLMAGLKRGQCEICGLSEWRRQPLPLELHHINGDGYANRLENLLLLCPNCHSQTDTWGGKNKARRAAA